MPKAFITNLKGKIMTIKALNKLSAALIVARYILEHYGCPVLKQVMDNQELNKLCDFTVTTATVAPIAIGAGSFGTAIYHIPKGEFVAKAGHILRTKLLPAGLMLFAAQGAVKGQDLPTKDFGIGLVKSAAEMVTSLAVCDYAGPGLKVFDKIAIAMSTTSTVNSLFFMGKEVYGGKEVSELNLTNAADYALGFVVARPMYNFAQEAATPKLLATTLYFTAPICRGAVLGAIGQGTAMVPGAKSGVAAQMIDGAAIAIGAGLADHVFGPTLTTAAEVAVVVCYKNQEAIGELFSTKADNTTMETEL
jgi:hypothetical protein